MTRRIRSWLLARRLRRIERAVDELDERMKAAGYCRQERRQVWCKLISGRVDARELLGGDQQ